MSGAGVQPKRRIHSSMYRDLRTNLPRYCMSYIDFPFIPEAMLGYSQDARAYPTHAEVRKHRQAGCSPPSVPAECLLSCLFVIQTLQWQIGHSIEGLLEGTYRGSLSASSCVCFQCSISGDLFAKVRSYQNVSWLC